MNIFLALLLGVFIGLILIVLLGLLKLKKRRTKLGEALESFVNSPNSQVVNTENIVIVKGSDS